MGFPLRFSNPDVFCFISNRCVEERFLLAPSPEVNALILSCLVRAAAKHKISLIGYVFMANHFHLIVRALTCNVGDFMRDFQSWLVIKLKRLPELRPVFEEIRGSVFPERFHQVDILDEEKAFEKLIYTLVNPCAADLVERPSEYPGVSSLHHNLTGEKVVGRWLDLEQYNRNRKRNPKYDPESATTEYTITLAPLPMMKGWDQERRRRVLFEALEARCLALDVVRGGKSVLGAKGVVEADRTSRPANPKKSHACCVIATDPEKVRLFLEHREAAITTYYKARKKDCDRNYEKAVKYPPGMCRPGEARATPYKGRQFRAGKLGEIFPTEKTSEVETRTEVVSTA